MELLWPWDMVSGLPWHAAILVFVLICLMFLLLVAVPALMLLVNEPDDFRAWFARQRSNVQRLTVEAQRAARRVALAIDSVNQIVGQVTAWVALFMVLMQFVVVIMRYVFNYGLIPMQESIWYAHGILFMVGAGYTLLYDGHVRVDIFYREATPRRKALVDIFGVVAFLLPLCVLTWIVSIDYVANSWAIKESSTEVSGLPFIYLLKTVIPVFIILVALQGVSLLIKSALVLAGAEPEARNGSFEPEV